MPELRTIPLTQGQSAIVDEEDFERLNQHKWYAMWSAGTQSFYARRNILVNGKQTAQHMHREVMGAKPGEQVDHRAHNTLDNRKSELRICACAQNQHNARLRKDNKSGFKGVSWYKQTKKWKALIQAHGKAKSLGYFFTAEEASKAYQKAALELHGEFAAAGAGQ